MLTGRKSRIRPKKKLDHKKELLCCSKKNFRAKNKKAVIANNE
jgi:hypothetical protein